MDADVARATDQFVRDRTFENLSPPGLVRLADNNIGKIIRRRIAKDFCSNVLTGDGDSFAAQLLSQS